MILSALLLSGMLATFHSPGSESSIGDTVAEMDKSIWIIYQSKHSNDYWFGSDGQGVYRYDGKSITRFSTKHGLSNDRIREIQEDRAGNIYIGTLNGINKFDGRKLSILKPVRSKSSAEGWRLNPNDLWFKGSSTESGPYRYDGKTLYHLRFPKHRLEDEKRSENPSPPASLYGVYTIYKDRKGSLWFGTAGLGLYRYDGRFVAALFEKHLTDTPAGGSFGIRSIIEDRDGKFWICNNRYRYTIFPGDGTGKENGSVKYIREKGFDPPKSSNGSDAIYYEGIVMDGKQNLWMSTYRGGVWRFDGQSLTHYPVTDASGTIRIVSIYKDNKGDLWLGTPEAGVYKFNGKTFERFKP